MNIVVILVPVIVEVLKMIAGAVQKKTTVNTMPAVTIPPTAAGVGGGLSMMSGGTYDDGMVLGLAGCAVYDFAKKGWPYVKKIIHNLRSAA